MTTTPTYSFPLKWPAVKPRTPAANRKAGPGKKLTVASARDELTKQLKRIDAERVIVSSNAAVNKNGSLSARQTKLTDPGVAIYFYIKGVMYVLACDSFLSLEANLYGLSVVLRNAMQLGNILGLDSMYEVLASLTSTGQPPPRSQQKPPPKQEEQKQKPPPRQEQRRQQPPPRQRQSVDWRAFFGLPGSLNDIARIKTVYKSMAQTGDYRHPDKGGSTEKFQHLQAMYEAAKKELRFK